MAVTLAEGLARVLPLERPYWIALTVVVVLQPGYGTTLRRGVGRIVGTVLGVVPATLLVAAPHPRGLYLVVLVGVLASVADTVLPTFAGDPLADAAAEVAAAAAELALAVGPVRRSTPAWGERCAAVRTGAREKCRTPV